MFDMKSIYSIARIRDVVYEEGIWSQGHLITDKLGIVGAMERPPQASLVQREVSAEQTEGLSPKRICSYQSRKSAKFTRIFMFYLYSRTTLCNGDNPSAAFGVSSLCTREPIFFCSLNLTNSNLK